MKGRTARRKAAQRWVRRSRPAVRDHLPPSIERLVLLPMVDRDGDLTHCPYWDYSGTCEGAAPCSTYYEPMCQTMTPGPGWPRQRLARGVFW